MEADGERGQSRLIWIDFTDGRYAFFAALIDTEPTVVGEYCVYPVTIFRAKSAESARLRAQTGFICQTPVIPGSEFPIKDEKDIYPWLASHGGTFLKDGYPLDLKWWPDRFEWQKQFEPFPELVKELEADLKEIKARLRSESVPAA